MAKSCPLTLTLVQPLASVILQSHAIHGATTRTTADFHQFGFTSATVPYLGFQKNIWKHLEMFEVSE